MRCENGHSNRRHGTLLSLGSSSARCGALPCQAARRPGGKSTVCGVTRPLRLRASMVTTTSEGTAMLSSRLWLAVPLFVPAVCLTACSAGSPGGGSVHAAAAARGLGVLGSAAPAGKVSTDGVCGLLPISKVNTILEANYATRKRPRSLRSRSRMPRTALTGTGVGSEAFVIQVATSHPADAGHTFNDATGDSARSESGIGGSAMFAIRIPNSWWSGVRPPWRWVRMVGAGGDARITLAQLEKLATAVHAAG